ncbi:MAG: hydantoinase/oxoprolinase family protein [Pseudomonadota bacterium]
MSFVIATDVGGTCTDTVIVSSNGEIHLGKVLSTPPNFAIGVIASVDNAAGKMGYPLAEVLAQATLFIHGSTVVDNTIITRSGAKTGLVTTKGFEDTLRVTRGAFGRWGGLNEAQIKHPVATDRAVPLAAFSATIGAAERVDYKGGVVEQLDEPEIRATLKNLIHHESLEAIAVCLLWSFKNSQHERFIRKIIEEIAPQCYVTLSSDIAPVPGEYERTSTTVINAYAGKVVRDYINDLEIKLREYNYSGPLLIMQGHGGLLNAEHAAERAVSLIECGPVAGLIGSQYIGARLEQDDIIAVDMGGTTSKVGVIRSQSLSLDDQPMVDRFHYSAPKVEVVSIGAGGGSLVSLEAGTNVPQVGPESAGSLPGPICYGNGGTVPTLTDVMLIIGYMAGDYFLGGQHKLDIEAAQNRFAKEIAEPLGLSVREAAAGIFRIACSQMSDLIHQITVERGLDPREFVLHAFGGTCPMLASTFAEELRVKKIVIPYTASVNCAFGMTTADVVHEFAETNIIALPTTANDIAAAFKPLLADAKKSLAADNFSSSESEYRCAVGMRYRLQVHELIVPIAGIPQDQAGVEKLMDDFEQLYEQRYGKGSAYKEAGMEITQCRVSAHGLMPRPALFSGSADNSKVDDAKITEREIFVEKSQSFAKADIYDFTKLQAGHVIRGPAVIHTPVTTIVIQEVQHATIDQYMNTVIEFS